MCNARLEGFAKPVTEESFIGKTITCNGSSRIIAKLISIKNAVGGWHIEFYDSQGTYQKWQQDIEGGTLS